MERTIIPELVSEAMQIQLLKPATAQIRILIVDDHVILRQGLCGRLNEQADFQVVAETEHEQVAVSLANELQPDIILLNIFLGTSNGLNAAKHLLQVCPNARIVVFAASNDEQLLFDALRIGVHGYLQKTLSIDELLSSLRAVKRGECVLGESHAITQVVNEFHRLTEEQNRLRLGISARDIEIMQLASQGYTNKEIGIRLFWSEIQIKRKMQEIYRKLQVADRAQAVAEAIHQGLI